MKNKIHKNSAMVLIICIWLIIMMTIIVMQMVHSGSMNMTISAAAEGQVRARWAARGGVDFALAYILNDSTDSDSFADSWFENESLFKDHVISEDASFSIYKYDPDSKSIRYGIADEASKINLTTITADAVSLDSEILSAERARDFADFFVNTDPVVFREVNPFYSLRDIARDFSLSIADCYGEDINLNAVLDWNENDGDMSFPPDNADGVLETGIFHFSTVYSYDRNIDKNGRDRVNINTATEAEIMKLQGISQENALWIILNRPFSSPAALFSADILPDDFISDISEQEPDIVQPSPQAIIPGSDSLDQIVPARPANRVIRMIYDRITVSDNYCLPGLININTVGIEVLACLPGIDRDIAQKIIDRRDALPGGFQIPADIFSSGAISYEDLMTLANKICVRSSVFTILVKGRCNITGQESFAEMIVERDPINTPDNQTGPKYKVLYWKQD